VRTKKSRPKEIIFTTNSVTVLSKEENGQLRNAVKNLTPELQLSLLQFALKWNANTRNCASGQVFKAGKF